MKNYSYRLLIAGLGLALSACSSTKPTSLHKEEFGNADMFTYSIPGTGVEGCEAARRALTRHIKRQGKVWIRVFPDVPVSKKPLEVRMGSGKGSPEFWVARVKPGRIMFEIEGVPEELARQAFELAAAKLPIATKFVKRISE